MERNRRNFLKQVGGLGAMAALGNFSAHATAESGGGPASHAPQFQIDHVTSAGRSLRQIQDSLASFGLKTENGGPHSNHATEMALLSFPDGSYLELIGLQQNPDPKAVADHYWSKLFGRRTRAPAPGPFGYPMSPPRHSGFPASASRLPLRRRMGALAWTG